MLSRFAPEKELLFYGFILAFFHSFIHPVFFREFLFQSVQANLTLAVIFYLNLGAFLKVAGTLFSTSFSPKKRFSYLSVSHKFFTVSLLLIFLVVGFVSARTLGTQQEENLAHMRKTSAMEIEKISLQLENFLVKKMKTLSHLSVLIEEKTLPFLPRTLELAVEGILKYSPEIKEIGFYFVENALGPKMPQAIEVREGETRQIKENFFSVPNRSGRA